MNPVDCKLFTNAGYLQTKLTDLELKPIKDEIKEIQKNFKKHKTITDTLAGNIEYEYSLNKNHRYIETLLQPYIDIYEQNYKLLDSLNILSKDAPVKLITPPWVNFMKKHEFNPTHNHTGIYSFVIWIDIPYAIEDELKTPNSKGSGNPIPGHFEFVYTDTISGLKGHTIPADKTFNNTLLIFPSKLHHAVYPFSTSDKYRISVSGNYRFSI